MLQLFLTDHKFETNVILWYNLLQLIRNTFKIVYFLKIYFLFAIIKPSLII